MLDNKKGLHRCKPFEDGAEAGLDYLAAKPCAKPFHCSRIARLPSKLPFPGRDAHTRLRLREGLPA